MLEETAPGSTAQDCTAMQKLFVNYETDAGRRVHSTGLHSCADAFGILCTDQK